MALELGFLKVIYSTWVSMTPTTTFILEEEPIQYKYNLIKFLSSVSKIISSQKFADIMYRC